MIEQFYVTTELARVERISIATEDFVVATELATTESFAAHYRFGRPQHCGAVLRRDQEGHARATGLGCA